ncbi:MAG: LacI family DNA-binding transcriptional regulator [Candidatus Ornithospirochaeta sp.]
MKNKRITIADIAQKSGYSKTAVSFAFNCPERISRDAVEKILKIAQELDYFPDPMARNFSLGRHLSLGFLVPQSFDVSMKNPHVVDVLRGIGSVCESYGYTITCIPPLRSSIAEAIKNATVDGIIGMGLEFGSEVQEAFKRRKLPFVCIDAIDEDNVISVSIDNEEAARRQMSEVLRHGHKDIAIISLPGAAYLSDPDKHEVAPGVAAARDRGYIKAQKEYGIGKTFPRYPVLATKEGGRNAMEMILRDGKPSCIITMSDIQALGAIEYLEEKGLRVPEDVSVVGFDGIYSSAYGKKLCSINQQGHEKGTVAAGIIFDILKGNEPKEKITLIPFTFKEGDTLRSL